MRYTKDPEMSMARQAEIFHGPRLALGIWRSIYAQALRLGWHKQFVKEQPKPSKKGNQ